MLLPATFLLSATSLSKVEKYCSVTTPSGVSGEKATIAHNI